MNMFYLNDIAGYTAEKEELQIVIDMFRRYADYRQHGAYLPKGLILSGEPGVGKTLFANVLANEIAAPFYVFNPTDYSERRCAEVLRGTFAKALAHTPCVLFIDELNTLVGDRNYSTDYTQRNLSALLKLIDGFSSSKGLLVIGASSDVDSLDEALLRSGRMDKHIRLPLPDYVSRLAIWRQYVAASNLDYSQVDEARIARETAGLTGADIKTLINETTVECVFRGDLPTDETLVAHIVKIRSQDISREVDAHQSAVLASHDLGHLVVAHTLLGTFSQVDIKYDTDLVGNTSLRFLHEGDDSEDEQEWDEDELDEDEDDDDNPIADSFNDGLDTGSRLLDKVATLMGGKAAEELLLGETHVLQHNDLSIAARGIHVGMDCGLFGFEYANLDNYYYVEISQELLSKRERKVSAFLNEQYARAREIVAKERPWLEAMLQVLMEKQSLSVAEAIALRGE